ncbi:hypothetical protein D3C81_2306880 [compost metagenome]
MVVPGNAAHGGFGGEAFLDGGHRFHHTGIIRRQYAEFEDAVDAGLQRGILHPLAILQI